MVYILSLRAFYKTIIIVDNKQLCNKNTTQIFIVFVAKHFNQKIKIYWQ